MISIDFPSFLKLSCLINFRPMELPEFFLNLSMDCAWSCDHVLWSQPYAGNTVFIHLAAILYLTGTVVEWSLASKGRGNAEASNFAVPFWITRFNIPIISKPKLFFSDLSNLQRYYPVWGHGVRLTIGNSPHIFCIFHGLSLRSSNHLTNSIHLWLLIKTH